MSSLSIRAGTLFGVGVIVLLAAGAACLAQEPKPQAPAAPSPVNVFNPVEGRVEVVSCKPEGTLVAKGDVVCELDPAPLKTRLAHQELVTQGAEAAYRSATLSREAAEIAVEEYAQGIFNRDLKTVLEELKLAESEVKRAEDRVAFSNRMVTKGVVSKVQVAGDQLTLQSARFRLGQVQTKKKVLVEFTKDTTLKKLNSAVEEARSNELRKKAVHDSEKAAGDNLRKQIERCKVVAPSAGRITYTRPFGPGASARDGELLFKILTDAKARPN